MVDPYLEANRRRWDEMAELHPRTEFYDLADLRAGGIHLPRLEQAEVGEVGGRSLLHLQCHIGTDTVSWVRLGARATGVDFSEVAVRQARQLADECGVQARFIHNDIATLPALLDERFDIVYTSWGVLCWQPDIAAWARAASGFVAPGGFLYLAEFHPFLWTLEESPAGPVLTYDYFSGPALAFDSQHSYADPDTILRNQTEYGWNFALGDVITQLIDNGLRVEFVHEFPRCRARMLDVLVPEDSPGDRKPWWRMPVGRPQIPLSFSLKASRPAD